MTAEPGATAAPVKLRCLGGEHGPAELGDHLRRLRDLPERALREIWAAIDASLDDPVTPDTERRLDAFCARHELSAAALGEVLKACRFLVLAAARLNATAEQFAADLDELTGEHALTREILVPGFERAKARVRQAILRATIEDHHKLVVDIGWQLERVVASDRAERMDVALAAVTFRYREGNEDKRITLHLLPEGVRALAAACQRIAR